ncbi:hypothetical protein ES288_D10G091900v1 [Gossypium darwinii]|uniref:Uncharacterized protein n=1 Tax=Gossypium darwinii TaxID=34276 RepID=A0A5D2AZK6_GOSDA|nr:hypothetical protein ES288_D10G091900v1 [Gossypium darwinii]
MVTYCPATVGSGTHGCRWLGRGRPAAACCRRKLLWLLP